MLHLVGHQGHIFNNYTANKIMKSCGKLKNFRIIPHGVSDKFRLENKNLFKENARKILNFYMFRM